MPDLESLIDQLTLEEKAALCTGDTAWTTAAVPRLGIPAIFVADGPHGLRRVADANALGAPSMPATCFPTASCLSSSWDVSVLRALGQAIAEEARALGVDVVLGPANNMKRTPLCGRNFEYYSEDPYLSGALAAAFIEGVQGQGVGTSLKHYAANNQEYQRLTMNAIVDERALREIYLPAFETAVVQARPWTVMCAYSRLNGAFGSENRKLLLEILREEWGFEGFVMSDWGAVHDRVAALKGGVDLEMPGPRPRRVQAVIDAVRCGELDEAALNAAVRRILGIAFKAAAVPKGEPFDAAAHHALARRIAGEGMVLLKNNGILPLRGPRRIAAIGRAAQEPHFQGGGSSHINPTQVDNPLEELRRAAGGAEITYAAGYPADDSLRPDLTAEAVAAARAADVALLYIALPTYKESEGYDRADLDLTAQQVELIGAVTAAQPKSVVILNNGSAVTTGAWIDGAAAVLEAWMMGQAGGGAIADVLCGKVNPSGKLSETFPRALADTPAYLNYPGANGEVRYGEGIFIGYRYYDAKGMPVAFPFGHGLSYTTFEYSAPRASADVFRDVDGVSVAVDVTNTGPLAGKEAVQVYVHDRQACLARPPKELKGFAKVELQPGETKTVTIPLDFRAFAYWHPGYGRWVTEDGEFDVLVGASSADIRGAVTVTLQSTVELPSILDRDSTMREWLADPRGKVVFEPLRQQLMSQLASVFGGGEGEEGSIGMDPLDMVMDMPLLSTLEFQENTLAMPPDAMVDSLLAQVYEQERARP